MSRCIQRYLACLSEIFEQLHCEEDSAFASIGLGIYLFLSKKTKLMHRGYASLPAWVDASTLLEKVLMQLKALYKFPKKTLSNLF